MLRVYGISNCDTVKKARAFLDGHSVSYEFVDFKKKAPTKELILAWANFLGELPVNKKGTTYKKLKDEYESKSDSDKMIMIIENSSIIKRPIFEKDSSVLAVGFNEAQIKGLFLG